jgi:hypothetical protein
MNMRSGIKLSLIVAGGLALMAIVLLINANSGPKQKISIRFVGFTNNPTGLLLPTNETLAVFSITNGMDAPYSANSAYWIETTTSSGGGSGFSETREFRHFSPLWSSGVIKAHGVETIQTRILTKDIPWRVRVSFTRETSFGRVFASSFGGGGVRDGVHSGDPVSDWVTNKPKREVVQ